MSNRIGSTDDPDAPPPKPGQGEAAESSAPEDRFDNRPTWDNWPNGPGRFDNQPTWDNWNNR